LVKIASCLRQPSLSFWQGKECSRPNGNEILKKFICNNFLLTNNNILYNNTYNFLNVRQRQGFVFKGGVEKGRSELAPAYRQAG
jgi:hypothetical protein